jgi:hypothetical protein
MYRDYQGEEMVQSQDTQLQARIMAGKDSVKLNPLFVEWLMGLPLHWTELGQGSIDFGAWETQWCLNKHP